MFANFFLLEYRDAKHSFAWVVFLKKIMLYQSISLKTVYEMLSPSDCSVLKRNFTLAWTCISKGFHYIILNLKTVWVKIVSKLLKTFAARFVSSLKLCIANNTCRLPLNIMCFIKKVIKNRWKYVSLKFDTLYLYISF